MEKKKIAARKTPTADEQERALQALLQAESPSGYPSVSKPNSNQSAILEAVEKPQTVEKTRRPRKPKPKRAARVAVETADIQRITVDLPADLYELLKKEVETSGTTIKWQIVQLLRGHFLKG